MASEAQAKGSQGNPATGTFTSAATAAAEIITLGFNPTYIEVVCNIEGTNADIVKAYNGATSSSLITGSTGVVTTPANQVTFNGDGTVTLAAAPQSNDGVNRWFALR